MVFSYRKPEILYAVIFFIDQIKTNITILKDNKLDKHIYIQNI